MSVSISNMLRPARTSMIVSGLLTATGAVFRLAPFVAMQQMAAIWLGEKHPEGWSGNPWVLALVALVCLLASQLLYMGGLGVTHLSEAKLRHKLRRRVVDSIGSLPLGKVEVIPHGRLRKIVCDDTSAIHTLVAHVPGDATNAVVSLLAGFVYLMVVDWRMCLALFGIWIVVVVGLQAAHMRGYAKITERFGVAQTDLASATVEMLEGIKEIKNFQAVDATRTRFNRAREKFSDISYEWVSQSGKAISATGALLRPAVIFVTVAILSVVFVNNDWMLLSATLPFFLVAPGVPDGLSVLLGMTQHIYDARLASQTTAKLLSEEPMPAGDFAEGEGEAPGQVEMVDAKFSYEPGEPVIDGISFVARPGTVTALVGPSGGGKSTLAKLIARFYDLDEGTVKVSGVDVRQASFSWLLSRVAIVLQDIALSNDTVFNNIALGKPTASLEEVQEAAKRACIHERIRQLPNGYDTVLGEEGGFLSGGERQRVTLARAYLQDASILILDEATAQADPQSERQIHLALSGLAKGRTVIMIAHRLATVRDADQILVVDGGRIVERGTHDQLLAHDGKYSAMWSLQMEGE
ncbi:ABC transporter ATP-binding protein [Propionimicrobium lymphophilum]|uniref:ABC transporter ATP-binding protein n=1 Tax=Propionimicrobium lymphophilum TaxID=33012 RepID=UPI0023F22E50|nr:ABC transporter ATP-binding protein [Propionimicrobium lymphophilum]